MVEEAGARLLVEFSAETENGRTARHPALYRPGTAVPYLGTLETASGTDGAMTLGTRLLTWLRTGLVGTDRLGRYYREKDQALAARQQRPAAKSAGMYNGEP